MQTVARFLLHTGVENMLNGLFCAGACLISFGAIIGKVSPFQLLVLIIIEPFFYWLNIFIGSIKLEAIDIGAFSTSFVMVASPHIDSNKVVACGFTHSVAISASLPVGG